MNDSSTAADSGTTKKTTRKRGGQRRKKVAPKEIAQGATPAPSKTAGPKPEAKPDPKPEAKPEAQTRSRQDSGADSGDNSSADSKPTRKKSSRSRSSSKSSGKSGSSQSPSPSAPSSSKGKSPARMLINYIPGDECRVALTVDGKLEEFHSERAGNLNIVGNIYVGKVMNVERSIQAAFIDFGYGVNGFLHISDLHPQYFPGEDENTTEKIGKKTPRRERPPIERCLKRGQKIVVQVLKEGISTKGPTLTSYLSIPGRFLVMLPDMDKVGVSRKVEDEDQRRTMRKILDSLDLPSEFGFILRTAGMNQTKAELKRDLAYLQRLWKDIDKRLGQGDKPRLLYAESDLLMRALRDIWTSEIDEIIVDDPTAIRRAYAFMRIVSPRSSTKLLAYDRQVPLFHAFGVEEQIERILSREVPLPSGGSLVIDEAEAMVAIDVNSGKSRNHGDAETMAFRINQEAVEEICRQIKLRDVGGLIMCDLIDMMKRSHRREIEKLMDDLLRKDRASTRALPISEFGIMELTRQRVRGSMKSVHFAKLDIGDGRGWVRRPDSVATNAMRDLAALLQHDRVAKVEMVVSPRVAGELLSSKRQALTRLELKLHKRVDVRVSESIAVDRVVMYAYDESGSDIEVDRLAQFRPPTDLAEYKPENADEQDWAVDATAEHEQDLEELVHEEAVKLDEVLAMEASVLSGDDDDDEDDRESRSDSDSSGGGKKRRRRRRRRRGGGGESDGESSEGDRSERSSDEPTKEDRQSEQQPERSDSSDDDQDDDGQPRKRRRRRRRRRRGGGGDSEGQADDRSGDRPDNQSDDRSRSRSDDEDSDEPDDRGSSRREVQVEAKAKREGIAPSGFPWRGDSWDLEPSALTMATDGGFKNPADAKVAEDLKAGREPEVASANAGSARAPERSDDSDDDGDDNGSGGGGRRRRRRRGGRSSENASDNGSERAGRANTEREPAKASADVDPPEAKRESKAPSSDDAVANVKPTPRSERETGRRSAGPRKGVKKAPADILIAGAVKPVAKPGSASDSSSGSSATTKKTTRKKSTSKKSPTKKTTAKKSPSKKTTTKKTSTKKTTRKKTTKKASS
jgi:ribonuclease E